MLWEAEPNDNALTHANGPIVSGLTYSGTFISPADVQDYFYFDLDIAHSVELWLANILVGHDYDLYLRDLSMDVLAYSDNPNNKSEHIPPLILSKGRYYIQIYNRSQTGSTQPYHLRVVYK